LTKNLSVFLDLLRFTAAMAVVVGHSRGLALGWLPMSMNQSMVAVAVFFVLSGFVIRFVTVTKEADWKSYVKARVLRIYPVAILAICLALLLLDPIGKLRNPAYYASLSSYNQHTSVWDVLSCLAFTNEIWTRHDVVGTAEPYWSLGFEVCYYVFLGLLLYTPRRVRIWAVVAWMLFVGPKILLYLPLWLLGAAGYEIFCHRWRPAANQERIGYGCLGAAVLVLYLAHHFLSGGTRGIFHFNDPQTVIWSALYYFCFGISIVLLMAGFDLATNGRKFWPLRVEALIRWLAGGSFTLYLLHLSLMNLFMAFFPSAQDSKLLGIVMVITVVVAAYLCAELAERRKRELKSALDKFGQFVGWRAVAERS